MEQKTGVRVLCEPISRALADDSLPRWPRCSETSANKGLGESGSLRHGENRGFQGRRHLPIRLHPIWHRSFLGAYAGFLFHCYSRAIYEWFATNLHWVREPSLRNYVRARELKAAGMDWTDVLAEEVENPRARLAAELLASPAYDSTAARVKAFAQQGGGCRATFFNYRRKLGGGNGTGQAPRA